MLWFGLICNRCISRISTQSCRQKQQNNRKGQILNTKIKWWIHNIAFNADATLGKQHTEWRHHLNTWYTIRKNLIRLIPYIYEAIHSSALHRKQIEHIWSIFLRIFHSNHLIRWKLITELILFTGGFAISDRVVINASNEATNEINYSIWPRSVQAIKEVITVAVM